MVLRARLANLYGVDWRQAADGDGHGSNRGCESDTSAIDGHHAEGAAILAIMPKLRAEAGFSLVELLVATGVLLAVSGVVTSALLQITNHQQTVWNRTEMHSGVRGATELLQQEIGQAGRIT